MLCCMMMFALIGANDPSLDAPLSSVALVPAFDEARFREPDAVLWPAYFWLWNAPLDEDLMREQLRDMAAHGARSVAMLPMPRGFRPDSTNNSMDPDYLTPEFFERVRFAVDEAARLGMHWWLYDEGGWPSGRALGKVVEGHPELVATRLVRESIPADKDFTVPGDALVLIVDNAEQSAFKPGDTWPPVPGDKGAFLYRAVVTGGPDLLSPAANDRFIALTHQGYRDALDGHLGKTVLFTFTDEPGVSNLDPPNSIPWTPDFGARYQAFFDGKAEEALPPLAALFTVPSLDMPAESAQARVDFYDLWTARFRDAYFGRIQAWCHENGLGSGGHLNGEDETINAVRYGFGHALRQCRAMDVPGVDLIWRQLFPGRGPQGNFPKIASSAAHQNGTRFAFTESFCVFGNGLTPAQMKWLVDYQYVRGLNLLVAGCFPLSTRDHHMTGERPHFGTMDPLWDHLPGYHAYVARLGYALSVGEPKISTALYYPVRDMWAWGLTAAEAAGTHDQIAAELLAHQCDFDMLDDDLMMEAWIEDGQLVAGAMRYNTIVCGDVRWMHPQSLEKLKALAAAGGKVLCVGHAPGTQGEPGNNDPAFCEIAAVEDIPTRIAPMFDLYPGSQDVRVTARRVGADDILFLFNEGDKPYNGEIGITFRFAYRLDPQTGTVSRVPEREGRVRAALELGESLLFLLTNEARETRPALRSTEDCIVLDDALEAVPCRAFVVGEHDFEAKAPGLEAAPFMKAAVWRDWIGEDFSGEVDYRACFDVPESWAEQPLVLETGLIEYAATVRLDGTAIGQMLWAPWRVELPPCSAGTHELVIRAANTLANELTSQRVTESWAKKEGPGWPSPYHARAIEFERESRGGGIRGPIMIRRMEYRQ